MRCQGRGGQIKSDIKQREQAEFLVEGIRSANWGVLEKDVSLDPSFAGEF